MKYLQLRICIKIVLVSGSCRGKVGKVFRFVRRLQVEYENKNFFNHVVGLDFVRTNLNRTNFARNGNITRGNLNNKMNNRQRKNSSTAPIYVINFSIRKYYALI